MKSSKRRENAYLTVEAAMVFPVVMVVQMLTVYLFLFQYDRCLLEQDTARLVVLGCGAETEEKSALSEYLKNCAGELSKDKYAAWSTDSMEMRLTGDKVCAEGKGSLRFPGAGWSAWSKADFWEAEASYEGRRLHPVISIRQYRKLKGEE